jgi:hypothetical protein
VSYSITHSRPTLRFAELLVAHAQRAASQPEPAGLAEDDLVAHEHRVADLADAIAVALGWGGRRRELLWDAARCHDEGKALISLEILEKPGSLTPQEYAEVTRHPVLGARTLEPFLTIQQVGWVLHHHERWDGQGYPERLARDDIPEGADHRRRRRLGRHDQPALLSAPDRSGRGHCRALALRRLAVRPRGGQGADPGGAASPADQRALTSQRSPLRAATRSACTAMAARWISSPRDPDGRSANCSSSWARP